MLKSYDVVVAVAICYDVDNYNKYKTQNIKNNTNVSKNFLVYKIISRNKSVVKLSPDSGQETLISNVWV